MQRREELQTRTRVTQDLTRSVSHTQLQNSTTLYRHFATKVPRVVQRHERTTTPPNKPIPRHLPDFIFRDARLPFLSRADPTASHGGPNAPLTVASCFFRGDLHETPPISHHFRAARSANGCAKHDRGNHRGHFVVPPRHVRTTDSSASESSKYSAHMTQWPLPR